MEEYADCVLAYISNASSDDISKAFTRVSDAIQCPQLTLSEVICNWDSHYTFELAKHLLKQSESLDAELAKIGNKSITQIAKALKIFMEVSSEQKYKEYSALLESKKSFDKVDIYKYMTNEPYRKQIDLYTQINLELPPTVMQMSDLQLNSNYYYELLKSIQYSEYSKLSSVLKANYDGIVKNSDGISQLISASPSLASDIKCALINQISNEALMSQLSIIDPLHEICPSINTYFLFMNCMLSNCPSQLSVSMISEFTCNCTQQAYIPSQFIKSGKMMITLMEIEREINPTNCHIICDIVKQHIPSTTIYDILAIKCALRNEPIAMKKHISQDAINFLQARNILIAPPDTPEKLNKYLVKWLIRYKSSIRKANAMTQ